MAPTKRNPWSRAVVLAVLAVVAPAAAQEPGARADARERARAVLPAEAFAEVERVAGQAASEGIPVGPLYDKALEGAAKRVPPTRIPPAVREYAGRLRSARQALGPASEAPLLVAGADALRRGVPRESLGRLGPPEARTPMALVVLADLVEAGLPVDHALDVVREAMAHRAGEGAMLDIPARLRRLMREGRDPRSAADHLRRIIREGRLGDRMPPGGATLRDRPGPPTPPGSEPMTRDRGRRGRGGGGPVGAGPAGPGPS